MFDEDPALIQEEFAEDSADEEPYTDEMISDIERIYMEMRK